MRAFRSDLPLRKTASAQFIQWLVMVLVFMAAVAATVHTYTTGLLEHWNRSVVGTLTVQVPPGADARASEGRDALKIALLTLQHDPAVAHASVIPRDKVLALLEPWL